MAIHFVGGVLQEREPEPEEVRATQVTLMTAQEQIQICKVLAIACMWGQGGVCSVIVENLDKKIPMERSWRQTFADHAKEAQREHMGVITDEDELRSYLRRGYWLCNGDSLFNPPPMNGLRKYVRKDLYDKFNYGGL